MLTTAVALVPMATGSPSALSCLALIQVLAFVLNILPVPGLDGFGVLEPFLSCPARRLARPGAAVGADRAVRADPRRARGVAVLFGVGACCSALIGGDSGLAGDGYGQLLFWR